LWKQGPWSVSLNAAFIYNDPLYVRDRVPGYTAGLTLQRRL
jgi:hypothetical protein